MTERADRPAEIGGAMKLVAAIVAGAAVACQGTPEDGSARVTASIGPEGGTIAVADGPQVDVPAGALPAPATLTLQRATDVASAPAGAQWASPPWTLQPQWLEFAAPVTVTFPVDPSALDAGLVVVTTAPGVAGALALAAAPVDPAHVATRSTRFATGGPAIAACPAACQESSDALGATLRCSAQCLGHSYVLSCDGPAGASSCTCAIDGVVTATISADGQDAGAAESLYGQLCGFPSSSWAAGM
jgi:hypothetical protein